MTSQPLRFGLAGTGYWARIAHAPALASTEGVELAAVWGRNPQATAELAAEYQATPYHDVAAFLAAVDAVCFAVPPDVQAPMATQAARAGKHLLLEKPIALSDEAADGLAEAIGQAGVASVVFFTQRFTPEMRAWLTAAASSSASGPLSAIGFSSSRCLPARAARVASGACTSGGTAKSTASTLARNASKSW